MMPQTKVFIGSLPQGSKPEELRKLFERYGVVTECDIMNRCGFVHMQTEEQAATAIRSLHNSTFNGAVISVERGRIKERGARGGPGGGRGRGGGGRGGMGERRGGGGPVRGGHPGERRDAPYMRDARPMGHMRGPAGGMQGMGMRNGGMGGGGGYERGADRGMGGGYDDRYGGYGAEDRRGFALMDARDPYAAPAPMYGDERRGYGAADDMAGMYPDERRAPMYPDERDMMDRRPMGRGHMPSHMSGGYDRPAPRAAPMGNGDMFSRRSPMDRGGAGGSGYDRDPYAQQYPPMGRGGGAPARSGGMGPRRY